MFKNSIRLFLTLKDIGFLRIKKRIIYELKRIIDSNLNSSLLAIFYLKKNKVLWKTDVLCMDDHSLICKKEKNIKLDFYCFCFLNEQKKLKFPFMWNNPSWSRLWQFNLHYFDWMREIIDKSLEKNESIEEVKFIDLIIDDWIKNNPLGKGDGWHSYTTSLRIRNWVWLFRVIPSFATKTRIDSLWDQICWLERHPEDCYGGNHWIENLTALAIGSMQFEGEKASKILKKSLSNLEIELKLQILNDGGHEERTASYHILILDRLVELACVSEQIKKVRFQWLSQSILKMTNFAECIQIKNNKLPLFNDSPLNGCPNVENTISFAKSFLNRTSLNKISIRKLLLAENSDWSKYYIKNHVDNISKDKSFVNFPNTGWCIFRPNKSWELLVKYGNSCPKHLPSHAHSDTLSFDLFFDGIPILVETGTSEYGNSAIRKYERSGEAHNVMQVSENNFFKTNNELEWRESVDTWGSFRAGRKSRTFDSTFGRNFENDGLWINSFHDGFQGVGIKYSRFIKIKHFTERSIHLKVVDRLESKNEFYWRQIWHLGPGQPLEFLEKVLNQIRKIYEINFKWKETWYSEGFGIRQKRITLIIYAFQKSGTYEFPVDLDFNIN